MVQALDLVGRKFFAKDGQLLKFLEEELSWFDKNNPKGELIKWVLEWEHYRQLMFESISILKKIYENQGKDAYVLYAVNMLDLMGDVLCCFHLLKQAQCAHIKWKLFSGNEICIEELLKENEEAKFYWNKLRTTEFYVWSILPRGRNSGSVF